MRKCERCGALINKDNIKRIHPLTYTACWYKCKECNWTDYLNVPDYIPKEQFKRYLDAKV